jgi:uncharacterized DUF497 family protein
MDTLPEPLSFEWDKGNLPKNLQKHDVTYQEAEEIFSSDPIVTTKDTQHSQPKERRYWALGRTRSGRMLFAAFTLRNAKVRVISVRDMTEAEQDAYEEFEKDS